MRRTAEDAAAFPPRRATGMRDVDAVVVVVAPAASLAMLLRFRVELAMADVQRVYCVAWDVRVWRLECAATAMAGNGLTL